MSVRLVFAVTETGAEAAAGDYFTAIEFGSALHARFGWQIEYRSKVEGGKEGWYDLTDIDYLVVMVEEYDLNAIFNASPWLIKIAWARNWFERWCQHTWIKDYDLHLASSRRGADFMDLHTGKRTRVMRIATNQERFNIYDRPVKPAHNFVFTGHYWQSERDMVAALSSLPPNFHGAIYGKNWEQVPSLLHLYQGSVPYSKIHEVYRQATVVIDDANHVTKEWGAANSRVFDALAAGCLVITNSQSVSDEVFDGRLPVYESPETLAHLLDHYLKHEDERTHLVGELRKIVLARHCYSHRALEFALQLRSLRKPGIEHTAFSFYQHAPLLTNGTEEVLKLQPEPAVSSALPFVSFVVPLFNHLEETRQMLTSLQASLPEGLHYEIILVDDASVDETPVWLKTLRDSRIKVLINETNRGYAATNNAGVKLAKGELLGLLNNDLIFEPGWLIPMVSILLSSQLNAGLVGNVQYRIADGELDHSGLALNPEGQLHHVQTLPNQPIEKVWAVTGACMMLHKADFEALGGFDETFVNGCEDIDLCFKMRKAGKAVYLASKSRICHHVSLSRKTNTLQDLRNSRLLFKRWRPEIKRKLSEVWRKLILAGPHTYTGKLQGELTGEFLATPFAASQVIAEKMLSREEMHWHSLLEDAEVVAPAKLMTRGLSFSQEHGAHLLQSSAALIIEGLTDVRKLCFCGHRIDDLRESVMLTIRVNNYQVFRIMLKADSNINAVINDPLLLSGMANTFHVETSHPLLLTYLVINDQISYL